MAVRSTMNSSSNSSEFGGDFLYPKSLDSKYPLLRTEDPAHHIHHTRIQEPGSVTLVLRK